MEIKVAKVEIKRSKTEITVLDSDVGRGLQSGGHSAMPDIDVDYQSDRRQEIKEYLEKRYNTGGQQRVFSAGTFSTMKLKAVLKDVARVYRLPHSLVNYITAIFEEDNMTWTDLFKLAARNPRIRKFVNDYPDVIEDIRNIMGQPRSASIHASAIIVTPSEKNGKPAECFDFLPIRKMDGLLVSEFDGYSVEEIGLLKEDVLATKELSKLGATIDIVNRTYGKSYTLESIARDELDDPKTYALLKDGYTQNVFQFASRGITRFIMDVRPDCIEDLIVINALYRPATLDVGATEEYVRYKRGEVAPVYNYGTYEATKNTFALMVFQEQFMSIAHSLGGFDLGKTDILRKAIGKKNHELMASLKDDFITGAIGNGCPDYEAAEIWHKIETAGGYSFNRCISGREKLYRAHSRWKPTIAEMYRIRNDRTYAKETGHLDLHDKYRKHGYGVAFSLDERNRIVRNAIADIRYMGVKPLYRITLANGKTIDVTDNHTHPTQRGKVRTDELKPGQDSMFVSMGYKRKDTTFRFTDKGTGSNPEYHDPATAVPFRLNARKGQSGFQPKPDSEYVRLKYYKQVRMADYCEFCYRDGCRLEIHHLDQNHSRCGVYFDNLVTLCTSCHKKEHYQTGRRKWGEAGLSTELVRVASVEYIGEDEVYDVEMQAPYHTFTLENGMVTCNSHAAAYALTAYAGAWLKANYPSAFYTVALQWADDKEIPQLMSEMELCSTAKIVPPNINLSDVHFRTDYQTDEIFWSFSRIKMVGIKTAEYIVREREFHGHYTSIEDFIGRIFRRRLKKFTNWEESDDTTNSRVPVNARHVKHLILAGCFDKLEKIDSVCDRYGILQRAAAELGFRLEEKDFPPDKTDKHYFWSIGQITVSGIGSIDYRRIYDNSPAREKLKGRSSYMSLRDALVLENEGKRIAVCATVLEVDELSYKDKQTGDKVGFAKLTLSQNNDLIEAVCWNDFFVENRKALAGIKDKIIILSGVIKYSDYSGCNNLNTVRTSLLEII